MINGLSAPFTRTATADSSLRSVLITHIIRTKNGARNDAVVRCPVTSKLHHFGLAGRRDPRSAKNENPVFASPGGTTSQGNYYPMPETTEEANPVWTMLVRHCARCGTDHFVDFRLFSHEPIIDSDGTTWHWWALCPETGEPVLMHQIQDGKEVITDAQ